MNKKKSLSALKLRLKKYKGFRWEIIERDYLLSWILQAIAQQPDLHLHFKGGTALKKCYFGSYRFSEDLDFTASILSPDSFKEAMKQVAIQAQNQLNEIEPCEIICAPYKEKHPHPAQQEAYVFRAKMSWHREPLVNIFVEISREEILCTPSQHLPILHEYGEKIDGTVTTYSLEEIVLEKLRGILQQTKKLHEQSWSRSRARDYYDLWRIFTTYDEHLNTQNFRQMLEHKCAFKEVIFHNVDSFFDKEMVHFITKTWDHWLAPLVSELPPASLVLDSLKPKIAELID